MVTCTVLSLGARNKVPLPLKYIFTVSGSPSTYFSWCGWALQPPGLYLSSAKKKFQVLFLRVVLLLPLQDFLLLRMPFTVRVGFLSLLSKSHAVGVFSINCYIQYFITVWRYMSPHTSQGKMKQGITEINSTPRSQPMSPWCARNHSGTRLFSFTPSKTHFVLASFGANVFLRSDQCDY